MILLVVVALAFLAAFALPGGGDPAERTGDS